MWDVQSLLITHFQKESLFSKTEITIIKEIRQAVVGQTIGPISAVSYISKWQKMDTNGNSICAGPIQNAPLCLLFPAFRDLGSPN